MSTDFTNPNAVMAFLFPHSDIYLNLQSRLVLGADFAGISDDELARRLTTYTYVASEIDLPKLCRSFGFAQLPDGFDKIHENVTEPRINAKLIDSSQLREFLAYHNRHDLRLYAAVRRGSWAAEGRCAFRPAWLAVGDFTFENFDEQSYLDSNVDIADGVKRGLIESGRAHFEVYGYREKHLMRRSFLPPAAVTVPNSTKANISASAALDRPLSLRKERALVPQGIAVATAGLG